MHSLAFSAELTLPDIGCCCKMNVVIYYCGCIFSNNNVVNFMVFLFPVLQTIKVAFVICSYRKIERGQLRITKSPFILILF